ncbi:MAG: glycosyltransferase [Bacteroidales bacterium]|nr:glycosyltransferase [Bacteroidales bacterium]
MPSLAVYTNSFPFGNSESFLETELNILSPHFDKIYIIPFSGKGKQRQLPENVFILPCIQKEKWGTIKVYIIGLMHVRRIFTSPELKKGLSSISFLKSLKYLGYGILTKNSIEKNLSIPVPIHYSYWLTFTAFSLSILKSEGKIKKLICRAHGYDLYMERAEKGLQFIQSSTIRNLDKLFLISKHGENYLRDKYPGETEKFSLSRLGTIDPGKLNPVNHNDNFTLVSCSVINPNKRVYLILDALQNFSRNHPAKKITWYHFGTGKELNAYSERSEHQFKNTEISCFFKGQLSRQELYDFYSSVPVDLFINVSESEGVPVSIMEAQSFSIPIVATNVGGNPEIVNDKNGMLINSSTNPVELSEILNRIYEDKENWNLKRSLSRKNWEDNFNAEKNYSLFADVLLGLHYKDSLSENFGTIN